MQFVAARQQFSPDEPLPAIKLPGFALVLEMKDPADFAKHLLLGYQKIVGIYNITGGMNGQPQMLMDSEELPGGEDLRSASSWSSRTPTSKKAPIQYNFSPSCATVGNRFILSSTVALARDLIDELKKPSANEVTSDNVAVVTDLTELATILGDNREPLVAQTQVRDGGTKEQAAAQFSLLLEALRATRTSSLRLGGSREQLWLEIAVGLPKYGEPKARQLTLGVNPFLGGRRLSSREGPMNRTLGIVLQVLGFEMGLLMVTTLRINDMIVFDIPFVARVVLGIVGLILVVVGSLAPRRVDTATPLPHTDVTTR